MWLNEFHPKLYDINQLLQLVLRGLECWSQPDSSLLQDQFRRHLVHIFDHDFPEHYGEVMQLILNHTSEQKILPEVLLDMLNSLLKRCHCYEAHMKMNSEDIMNLSVNFAKNQNLFNLKAVSANFIKFLGDLGN